MHLASGVRLQTTFVDLERKTSEKSAAGAVSGRGPDWPGGFLCPCHGSTFDLAGRVFRNKPAPTNLGVPPYRYLAGTRLLIGAGEQEKG